MQLDTDKDTSRVWRNDVAGGFFVGVIFAGCISDEWQREKELSETDICRLFIAPAITTACWDAMKQIRQEVTLTPGPIIVSGNVSSAFFFKQWGGWGVDGKKRAKKQNGRLLQGSTCDAVPAVSVQPFFVGPNCRP